jgi:6-pyruvoyltetrahydropterin/6-carboxytetrahydropterin synthase
MELLYAFEFEAAHRLPMLPAEHACAAVHGHRFRVRIAVDGPLDHELGWVMDFREIEQRCEPVRARLDHALLNEIAGLENPTCENLARWIWSELKAGLPGLATIEVWENRSMGCRYAGGAA